MICAQKVRYLEDAYQCKIVVFLFLFIMKIVILASKKSCIHRKHAFEKPVMYCHFNYVMLSVVETSRGSVPIG